VSLPHALVLLGTVFIEGRLLIWLPSEPATQGLRWLSVETDSPVCLMRMAI
jgi:hypothetical protein